MPIDPVLSDDFFTRDNEHRSPEEIDLWWDRPFAVSHPQGGYDVLCLDGGAWDRPTWYGFAATVAEAEALAESKLAAWMLWRQTPQLSMFGEGQYFVCRLPQRPGDSEGVLYFAHSAEDAARWIKDNESSWVKKAQGKA